MLLLEFIVDISLNFDAAGIDSQKFYPSNGLWHKKFEIHIQSQNDTLSVKCQLRCEI